MSNSELSASTDLLGFPPVLDACCGSRMFWFDKKDYRALHEAAEMVAELMCSNAEITGLSG